MTTTGQLSLRFALTIGTALFAVACGRPDSPAFLSQESNEPAIATETEALDSVFFQAETAPPAEPTPIPTPESELTLELRRLLNSKSIRIGQRNLNPARLKVFYAPRAEVPLFVSNEGLLPLAESMKNALREKPVAHGLLTSDYWMPEAHERWTKTDVRSRIELEILLAANYMQLITDIHTGRTNPQDSKQELPDIELKKRDFKDFKGLLDSLSSASTLEASFDTYAPPHTAYKSLLSALARLNQAKAQGGWETISYKKTLRKGDSDSVIPAVRKRLYDLGLIQDRAQRSNPATVFDDQLYKTIVKFQDSFKLGTDGIIGRGTFRELAIGLDARIDQVRANLERWRLLPRELGETYILVDLNQQELTLTNAGRTLMHMKTIVGRDARPTPTFADRLTSVIVNPYWHAPISIVVKDILPKATYNPSHFSSMYMRIFDKRNREIDPYDVDWGIYSLKNPPPYTFRQDPGDHNSLGRLKFDLSDNRNSIYLHDTNHRELFKKQMRMFSSGCIRVEHPRQLAAYLLEAQGHDARSIDRLIADNRVVQHRLRLTSSVRVYILGQTIAVDENGGLRFGRDFHDQDGRVIAALNGKPVPGSSYRPPEEVKQPEPPAPPPRPWQPSRPSRPRPQPEPPWSPWPWW